MGKNRWTPAEDAVIRENANHGPAWDGYEGLLPGRSQTAIAARRKALGVAFVRPGRQADRTDQPSPRAVPALEIATDWTADEIEALVSAMRNMTEKTHHTVAECLEEFGRLVAELRKVA